MRHRGRMTRHPRETFRGLRDAPPPAAHPRAYLERVEQRIGGCEADLHARPLDVGHDVQMPRSRDAGGARATDEKTFPVNGCNDVFGRSTRLAAGGLKPARARHRIGRAGFDSRGARGFDGNSAGSHLIITGRDRAECSVTTIDAVAAARTKRTGLDGGTATLRDLVLDERGAGATHLEPTDRALAAPRLAAHCKTDVAIACGDRRVTGWYDRASPSGRTESAAFHLSILSLGHFSVAEWLVLLRSPRDTSPVLQKARQDTEG